MAGANADDPSICCWFVGVDGTFELEDEEDEEDEGDELLELELDEEIADEEEPEVAWEEEIAAFEVSDGPELANEQKDCVGWMDLPSGTMTFGRFFTIEFEEKCTLKSFVSTDSGWCNFECICRPDNTSPEINSFGAFFNGGVKIASPVDCVGFIMRLEHYK